MADATISALSAAATADRTYEIPVNKTGANETVKVTIEQIVNLVSNTISAVSLAQAATSADLTSAKNRLSALSGQVTSADDAISAAVAVVSADVTSVKAVLSNLNSAHNALSNTVSGLGAGGASVTSAEYLSLVNRVSANSGVGGGGSVTSQEVSVLVAAESAGRVSADNALSVNLASVDSRLSANSAQMTSADNAISAVAADALSKANAISQRVSALVLDSLLNVSAPSPTSSQVLKFNSAAAQWVASADAGGTASVTSQEMSVLVAAESAGRVSADNALSVNLASVDSRLSTLSAQVTSADNAISNAVSLVSVVAANAVSIANAVSQKASVLSVNLASVDGRVNSVQSSLSTAISAIAANSAQMTSADNAISAAVVSLASVMSSRTSAIQANSAQMTSADNAISAAVVVVSADLTSVKAVLSNLTSAHNALSNTVSGLGGGGASVTSAEYLSLVNRVSANSGTGGGASVTSAEYTSLLAVISNALSARDVASNAISIVSAAHASLLSNHIVLSNKVSALAPWAGAQIRIVSTEQSTTGSALVDISGLVLTVAAGETWEVDGMILVSTSVATAGLRLGCSVTPLSSPRWLRFNRVSGGQSAGIMGGGGLMQVSGSSTLLSLANTGSTQAGVGYKGIFNVASSGTFRLQYGGIASVTASPINIMPGSYMKAFRLK